MASNPSAQALSDDELHKLFRILSLVGVVAVLCDAIPTHYVMAGCLAAGSIALVVAISSAGTAIRSIIEGSSSFFNDRSRCGVFKRSLAFLLLPLTILFYLGWFVTLVMERAAVAMCVVVSAFSLCIIKMVTNAVGFFLCDEGVGVVQHALVVGLFTSAIIGILALAVGIEHIDELITRYKLFTRASADRATNRDVQTTPFLRA